MVSNIEHLAADLLSIANDAALLVDDSGQIVFANDGATQLTGYGKADLVGSHFEKLVPKALWRHHQQLFADHMESGPQKYLMGKRGSVDLVTKAGSKLQVGISLAKRQLGGRTYVAVILTDYTEMEKALSNLRSNDLLLSETVTKLERAQRRFAFAQTLTGIGSWDWDIGSGDLFWSDEVYAIFGLTPGQMRPTYEAFLGFIHPDDRAAVESAVQSSLNDPSQRYDIIHRIILGDGHERIVREMGMVEVDENGKPVLMVGSVQDITEAQQLKEKTESALLREAEASRTKSEFLANLSHELRTPLNAVIGFSTLLKDTKSDKLDAAAVMEYANYIYDAGTNLHQLVDDILEVSRIDIGIVELRESAIDLGKIVQTVKAILHARAEEKRVEIVCDAGPDNTFQLDGDELRIKQILLNLVGNSVKFSYQGGVVRISIRLRDDNGIQIVVSDNGCGMDQEKVENVLERFNRAESVYTSTHEGGLGLGLTLSKAYCTLHDGTISIETAPEQGMRVQLDFPPERTITL